MSRTTKLQFDVQRTLGFAGIGANYAAVGTGLTYPASQLFIQNLTNVSLQFSFDGINDHFPLASNAFFVLDITTNKFIRSEGLFLPVGTTLYVKEIAGGAAPASGSVYFSYTYALTQ
jgi:hypothetical protein